MNEEIIKRWNKKIDINDVVYVLGDVCWGWNSNQIQQTFSKMNGIKYLIIGNHDKLTPHQKSNVWAEIVPIKELQLKIKVLFYHIIQLRNGIVRGINQFIYMVIPTENLI